jgi:hypothetical protein
VVKPFAGRNENRKAKKSDVGLYSPIYSGSNPKLAVTHSHACAATLKTKKRLPGRITSHFDS